VDCSKFESQLIDPLDKVKSLCPLGKKNSSARGEADVEGNTSLQGDGVFGVFRHIMEQILELLGCFSKTLNLRCGFSKRLRCKSLFGLKCRMGFVVGWVLGRYMIRS
jgi:hypothetical protein